MGCDIHIYTEYRSRKAVYDDRPPTWIGFGGRVNPGRNYAMFALMADVRNDELPVAVSPRGMPDDAGYYSREGDQMYICESEGDNYVKMSRAENWVKSGSSKFINNQNGKPTWVTNPDWHSHSWLSTSEFEGILNKYFELEFDWHKQRVKEHLDMVERLKIRKDSWAFNPPETHIEPQYQAILAGMKRFEELGFDARIVFWFDN